MQKHEISVYSTPTCQYCRLTKEYLNSKKITFKNIDVTLNQGAASEMIQKSGQMGVPVLDIDGEIIVGFDKKKINKALNIS